MHLDSYKIAADRPAPLRWGAVFCILMAGKTRLFATLRIEGQADIAAQAVFDIPHANN